MGITIGLAEAHGKSELLWPVLTAPDAGAPISGRRCRRYRAWELTRNLPVGTMVTWLLPLERLHFGPIAKLLLGWQPMSLVADLILRHRKRMISSSRAFPIEFASKLPPRLPMFFPIRCCEAIVRSESTTGRAPESEGGARSRNLMKALSMDVVAMPIGVGSPQALGLRQQQSTPLDRNVIAAHRPLRGKAHDQAH